jgi:hypothetical protein
VITGVKNVVSADEAREEASVPRPLLGVRKAVLELAVVLAVEGRVFGVVNTRGLVASAGSSLSTFSVA